MFGPLFRRIPVILFLCIGLFGAPAKRPEFQDFAVNTIYRGSPAPPQLVSRRQKLFSTVIRQGARSSVQFAGHYTVPVWGCGSACSEFAIADSITGTVYDGLFATDFPLTLLERLKGEPTERIEFHPGSRLLKVNGCPNEHNCGFYDYEMVDGVGLKLIRKELLPDDYHNEQDAQAVVTSLYIQIVKRKPLGIPRDADRRALYTFLSQGLVAQLNGAEACESDYYRQHPGDDRKPEFAWLEMGLFLEAMRRPSRQTRLCSVLKGSRMAPIACTSNSHIENPCRPTAALLIPPTRSNGTLSLQLFGTAADSQLMTSCT